MLPAAAPSVAGGSEEDWGTAQIGMKAPAPAPAVVADDDDWGTASFGMSSAAAAPAPAAAGEDDNWQTVCL